jgi:hypothetical protein
MSLSPISFLKTLAKVGDSANNTSLFLNPFFYGCNLRGKYPTIQN